MSPWSDYVIVPVSAEQPSTSTPVLTAEVAEGSVELGWEAITGAVRYVLWAWTSANEWQQIGGDSLTDTTYTHSDVTAGTTYYYQMRAVNAGGGTSAWSIRMSETIPAAQQ